MAEGVAKMPVPTMRLKIRKMAEKTPMLRRDSVVVSKTSPSTTRGMLEGGVWWEKRWGECVPTAPSWSDFARCAAAACFLSSETVDMMSE